jgi:hypothetical protein
MINLLSKNKLLQIRLILLLKITVLIIIGIEIKKNVLR